MDVADLPGVPEGLPGPCATTASRSCTRRRPRPSKPASPTARAWWRRPDREREDPHRRAGDAFIGRSRRESAVIVPPRALACECWPTLTIQLYGLDIGVSTGNYESEGGWLADEDIIVATSEKVDSLVRNNAAWMDQLTCVVTDEVHLVDDGERGPTLEVTLAKLRRLNHDLQTVALSATIGNAEALATWLERGSSTLIGGHRPPKGVHYGQALHLEDGSQQRLSVQNNEKQTAAIVRDTLEDDGSTLVFVNSRRNAEAAAGRLANTVRPHLDRGTGPLADSPRRYGT